MHGCPKTAMALTEKHIDYIKKYGLTAFYQAHDYNWDLSWAAQRVIELEARVDRLEKEVQVNTAIRR